MKIFIAGEVFDTKNTEVANIKRQLQRRLFEWLGLNENGNYNFKVDSVSLLEPTKLAITFSRHYGDFYDSINSHNEYIFSYDRQILLGEGYITGGTADFTKHSGRYVISSHINNFLEDYKQAIKGLHCSRMKKISISEIPDKITITYEVYGRKKNP